MLLMLMMLSLPRAAIAGATAATRKYGARTLLANSASNVSVVRSAAANRAAPPARSMPSTAWAPRPASRPRTMTSKPSRAKAMAMARPRSEVAPVTSAFCEPWSGSSKAFMTVPCRLFLVVGPRPGGGWVQCAGDDMCSELSSIK
jgi:hypothetical protein